MSLEPLSEADLDALNRLLLIVRGQDVYLPSGTVVPNPPKHPQGVRDWAHQMLVELAEERRRRHDETAQVREAFGDIVYGPSGVLEVELPGHPANGSENGSDDAL